MLLRALQVILVIGFIFLILLYVADPKELYTILGSIFLVSIVVIRILRWIKGGKYE